jgi:tetratricopeptide (TPR) repeat protein
MKMPSAAMVLFKTAEPLDTAMTDANLFPPGSSDFSDGTAHTALAESETVLSRLDLSARTDTLSPELQEHLAVAWLRKIAALHALRRYDDAVRTADDLQRYLDGDDARAPVHAWAWLAQAACRKAMALAMQGELPAALEVCETVQKRFQHAEALPLREWVAFAGLDEIKIRTAMGATFARVDMVRYAQQLTEQFQQDDWPPTRLIVGRIRLRKADLLAELGYTDDANIQYRDLRTDLAGTHDDGLQELAADALLSQAHLLKAQGREEEYLQALQAVIDECSASTHGGTRCTLALAQFDLVLQADDGLPTVDACDALLASHDHGRPAHDLVLIINRTLQIKTRALADDDDDEADAVAEDQWARYAGYPDIDVQTAVMESMLGRMHAWDDWEQVLEASDRLLAAFTGTQPLDLVPLLMRASLLKSWALRVSDQEEAALALLDELEQRYADADSLAIFRQRVNAVVERGRVLLRLQRPDDAAAVLARTEAMLDAADETTAEDTRVRGQVSNAMDMRVDILAKSTPGKHPQQDKGKNEAGDTIRMPLTPAEQAYADAVLALARRFNADTHVPIRVTVATALYNLGLHQRERLHIDEALSNYGLVLQYFAADTDPRIESIVASSYLNRAYVLLNVEGRNADALADYDAMLARFSNATSAKMRDTLARAGASRLTCLNRMQREGQAVNYGDQYEEVTAEQRDALTAIIDRGIALGKVKKYREAIAAYDEVLSQHVESLHPELRRQCCDALARKAYNLGQWGKTEAALATNNEVIARYGNDLSTSIEKNVAYAMSNKTWNLDALERNDEKLQVYDQIIERWQHSNLEYFRRRVAAALFSKGCALEDDHKEQALAVYTRCVNDYLRDEEFPIRLDAAKSTVNLAALLRTMKRYAESIPPCEEMVQACGEDTDKDMRSMVVKARTCLARSHAATGDTEKAVEVYTQLLAAPADVLDTSMRNKLRGELLPLQRSGGVLGAIGGALKGLMRGKQAGR